MRQSPSIEAMANVVVMISALLSSIAIAWWSHAAVNFGYPVLYDLLAIDAHIAEYAPANRYREGFGETTRAERLALFDALVTAINNGGVGLAELTYRPAADAPPVRLLREPEVVHLQAVSRLVSVIHYVGLAASLSFVIALVAMHGAGLRLWRYAPLLALVPLGVVAAGGMVIALDTGKDGWFAWFHESVFGADHQWYFVYEASLMTTLLKAPDLFLPLAISLGGCAIGAFVTLWFLAKKLCAARTGAG